MTMNNMKALFLAQERIWNGSGISQKILSQCKGLANNGIDVSLCHLSYYDGRDCYVVDGEILFPLGIGFKATARYYAYFSPIINYVKEHQVSFIYIRYIHRVCPLYINFLKRLKATGVTIFIEIPTFPYDGELDNTRFRRRIMNGLEKFTRRSFKKYVDRIITVQAFDKIYGIPTIKISNGIVIDKIPLRNPRPHSSINLLGVATMRIWHGYDRLIEGIGLYYKNGGKEDIQFYLVGENTRVIDTYKSIVSKYGIDKRIHFEGIQVGNELDAYFDLADLAIGSLGIHRTVNPSIDAKPLKCIEYAARGIPFIYSNMNLDFDDKEYKMRMTSDDNPIDMIEILDFLRGKQFEPSEIRKTLGKYNSWDYQMSVVLNEFNNINR